MFKILLKGMRPKTLIAAIVPCLVAFSLYYYQSKVFATHIFLLCIGLGLCIQIATNFYNDAIDFLKGADVDRIGPDRVTTQDQVGHKVVFLYGHFFISLAILCAYPLFQIGGLPFVFLGVCSLFLTYGYTGGPFPLAYLGLGEVFVFIFFGLVATVGSFYLMSLDLNVEIWICGSMLGLLSCSLIAVNNFRDRETDIKVNKRTLATKMSREKYLRLIDFFLFTPYVLILYFIIKGDFKFIANLLSIGIAYKIHDGLDQIVDLRDCNKYLAKAGLHIGIFSLIFCGICLWI